MAGKGVKVKELATELGVTSRLIVARCRAAGFPVQNSITRLNPEQERTIRSWFASRSDDAAGPTDDAERGRSQ